MDDSPILPPWTKTESTKGGSTSEEEDSSSDDSFGQFEEVEVQIPIPSNATSNEAFLDQDASKDIQPDTFIIQSFQKAISI